MDKFIYVFSDKDRDRLLENGYVLVSCNKSTGMYVFVNRCDVNFSLSDVNAVTSNVLSF